MATPGISSRARRILEHNPPPEYITERMARAHRAWTPEDPSGYIDLSTAENKLMWDVIGPRMAAIENVPHRVMHYDEGIGNLEFRRRISKFLGPVHDGTVHDPARISVLAGAGAALEAVFYALCDPGDGVLVPTPSYAGFWMDIESRDEAKLIPVHTAAEDGFRLTPDLLDDAIAGAGRPVKALLVTSPNNPLGTVLDEDHVAELIDWANRADLHVVFDELYSLSVFDGSRFRSAAAVSRPLPDHVHIIWAFSKDFAASGLRCGVLITGNPELRASVRSQSVGASCSGDTQYRLAELIADDAWTVEYVRTMRQRLAASHDTAVTHVEAAGIRRFGGGAGHFFLIDLRPYLPEATFAAERELWREILDDADVNLTPGAACRISEPGFFRLCFAWNPREAIGQGVDRIARVLAARA
jgi:aspartate/methionine/tyrosine aminotransferase